MPNLNEVEEDVWNTPKSRKKGKRATINGLSDLKKDTLTSTSSTPRKNNPSHENSPNFEKVRSYRERSKSELIQTTVKSNSMNNLLRKSLRMGEIGQKINKSTSEVETWKAPETNKQFPILDDVTTNDSDDDETSRIPPNQRDFYNITNEDYYDDYEPNTSTNKDDQYVSSEEDSNDEEDSDDEKDMQIKTLQQALSKSNAKIAGLQHHVARLHKKKETKEDKRASFRKEKKNKKGRRSKGRDVSSNIEDMIENSASNNRSSSVDNLFALTQPVSPRDSSDEHNDNHEHGKVKMTRSTETNPWPFPRSSTAPMTLHHFHSSPSLLSREALQSQLDNQIFETDTRSFLRRSHSDDLNNNNNNNNHMDNNDNNIGHFVKKFTPIEPETKPTPTRILHKTYSSFRSFSPNSSSHPFENINERDRDGKTFLHWAVELGDLTQAITLIESGADVNATDNQGNTPIITALHHKHEELVYLLLEYQADLNVRDKQGNTPLHLCFHHNFADLAQRLVGLAGFVDINVQNNNGNSPLLLACHNRHFEIIKRLIQEGADVNVKNRYNDTPLLWASSCGYFELVMLLLNKNADIECLDKYHNTPLHKACSGGFRDIVEILIEKGSNLRAKNDFGQTPLDLAATPQIRKLCEGTFLKLLCLHPDYDPGTKSWKWEVDFKELQIDTDHPIGEGNYSVCYLAKLHGTPVAVKQLKTKITDHVIQSFNHEVGLMSDIKNPYCLLFIGACIKYPHLCIITEYVPKGSLREYLDRNTLVWQVLLKFAITTARGMAWLHSRKPAVLHRDMHSNNILVSESLDCKVADFGLSQIQGSKLYESRTIYKRIIPPEIFKGELYTKKSDVYMYGLILYELLTGKKADAKTSKAIHMLHQEFSFSKEAGRAAYIELIQACCHDLPEKRPEFEEILPVLEMIHEKDNQHTREKAVQISVQTKGEYIEE